MSKNHYVYYSYEEWGRGYIGSRTCKCLPAEDVSYFGSFKDKTFKPTKKIILAIFSSRKEALEAEIKLHEFYKVNINSHFANQVKQTSIKFSTQGAPAHLNPMYGRVGKNNPNYGKKWCTDGERDIFCSKCPYGFYHGRSKIKGSNNSMYGKRGVDNPNSKLFWFTNGDKNIRAFTCPVGFTRGFTNKRGWFTNGVNNVFSTCCPDGYIKGRTIYNKETNIFYNRRNSKK